MSDTTTTQAKPTPRFSLETWAVTAAGGLVRETTIRSRAGAGGGAGTSGVASVTP